MNDTKRDACTKAIAAHADWKNKFKKFMAGELALDAAQVDRSDACDFGRWLATRPALDPTLAAEIARAHAHFHHVAAGVVTAKKTGQVAKAEAALAVGGDFAKATTALTHLVVKARDAA